MKRFDVIVIGAGPAGYVAAIRCAQLGMETACVDSWINEEGKPALGGTCLNVGCIPSKALLESSETYHKASQRLQHHGIKVAGVELDLGTMMARKSQIVKTLTSGIATLFKRNKVHWLPGRGRLLGGLQVEITGHDGRNELLQGRHVILATGSSPTPLTAAPLDGKHIVDSSGALSFPEVPAKLGIIGAGVIGLELGSVWQRLGSEVVVLEAQDQFLSSVDRQVADLAYQEFTSQGLAIHLGARVTATHVQGDTVVVHYRDGKGDHVLEVDRLVVAVGRRPNTQGLFDEESGLLLDERGYVQVDEHCRTDVPEVYAIGDLVRGPMLAHKGSDEGIAVAERIAGMVSHVNYDAIPFVIYTHPEIAWVGKTSQELHAAGIDYRTGIFPFRANGRAMAMEEARGLIKILSDPVTDQILGVHMIGAHVSEMVAEAVLAMEFGASSEDLARTCHAHPTMSEALREAALATSGRAIHI